MRDRTRTVLVATTVHNPLDNRIFLKQIASLIEAGWQVQYLCRREGHPEDVAGLKVFPVSLPRSRLLRGLVGNFLLLRQALLSPAAILHVHDPELFVVARIVGLRYRRVILDLHDLPHEQVRYKPYLSEVVKKPFSRIVEWVLKIVLFRATVVVAESSYLDWVGKVTSRYLLVRNFPVIPKTLNAGYGIRRGADSESLMLGYVGVISRARGAELMVHAMQDIASVLGRKIALRLIGAFESSRLQEEVLNDERVEYLGYRLNDEAQRLLADVDIGIALTARTPNYDHSLSTKILEYILLRLPVVATNNPINRELFGEFPTVHLVDPDSVSDFAATIVDIARNPPEPALLDTARQRVLTRMNWSTEFSRMLQTYESAIEFPARKAE